MEQLKIYADIIDLPLEVVLQTGDLISAIDHFSSQDLIFIDTAGRSPHNEPQMGRILISLVAKSTPDEVILVLSATTKTEDLLETYQKSTSLKLIKLYLPSSMRPPVTVLFLNVVNKTRKRLSYVTNGQNVPDDIVMLDEFGLARLIVGADSKL